jgi:protein-S-isoprenylcysteine O-methyltransferase Ste14
MSLEQSLIKQGSFLFKYRGQFPVILFLLSIPFIYFTSFSQLDHNLILIFNYFACFLTLLGFLIRFYTIGTTPKNTSGRNTKKQIADTLNTLGIYSIVRHPLYLGNYLIWLGIAIYSYNIEFVILMSLLFWLYYERIMLTEEEFLKSKFQQVFLQWSNNVPAFFPRKFIINNGHVSFSIISVLRREYSSVLSSIVGFLFIDVIRNIFTYNTLFISPLLLNISVFFIVIILILRTLKHHTSILIEEGRS